MHCKYCGLDCWWVESYGTRKLMTMIGALHPRADMDRLYVTWGEGGRWWMSVDDVVSVKEHKRSNYMKGAEVNSDTVLDERITGTNHWTKEVETGRWIAWQTATRAISVKKNWWKRRELLKMVTDWVSQGKDRKLTHGSARPDNSD